MIVMTDKVRLNYIVDKGVTVGRREDTVFAYKPNEPAVEGNSIEEVVDCLIKHDGEMACLRNT